MAGALEGQIALVTGASRGIGKGIALALGRAGATVYVTGRTEDEANAAVPLAGTIHTTAAEVSAAGGKGIAMRCDHADDEQTRAAVERLINEQGRIDILVNNAWRGYEGYSTGEHFPQFHPFWQKPLHYWDENMDGVRWAYITTALAAAHMVKQASGIVVNISFNPGLVDPAYGASKAAIDRLTAEFAHALKPHNIAVMGLYPGLVRTESVILNAQYFDMTQSQSPEFTGRAVVALAADPARMEKSGVAYIVADLSAEYGFKDDPYPAG
jgi:NAD(P)-dependent dehydrogenase (short-subunit alcohol dehydrogenase family)